MRLALGRCQFVLHWFTPSKMYLHVYRQGPYCCVEAQFGPVFFGVLA